ncbi:MAG: beta-Ala-His dipeptidase [Oscillospiraceae bacterium]|nr:beta-Ala-His dipeptidase [Oscillospiraceae bacterium]
MQTINELQPEKVYRFFNEISEIPHGSGNTAQIAQYCLDFAAKRGLKAVKDAGDNVIIFAPGTEGYENSEPVIIQGHMDMVCEKTADCIKNMETEGLDLCTDGEWLWAEGTTLGGDDGIALAYMFALLDSDDIPHPPLECVITRDEETGMFGAELFEAGYVKGKKILNIDSEEEGILTVSCAGGITAHCEFELTNRYTSPAYTYEITVSGLRGGHSGVDIGKGRLNAFKMLSEPLGRISKPCYFGTITGGGKHNVIPQTASIVFGCDEDILDHLEQVVRFCNEKHLGGDVEPDLLFSLKEICADKNVKFQENTIFFEYIYDFLRFLPTGVQSMSESIEGMVETSLNMGVLEVNGMNLSCDFLIRSNSDSGKDAVVEIVRSFCESIGDEIDFDGMTLSAEYPAWEYRKDSPLRDLMVKVFRTQYGKEPVVAGIHAGLECGIFSKKIADADAVSFGPDIENIHTPNERLNIASAQRTWEYLKEILKQSR